MYSSSDFAQDTGISEASLGLYKSWYSLLTHWNKSINLVQHRALDDFWARHALDSQQIVKYLPKPHSGQGLKVLDLGSGAGFPAIAVAIFLKELGPEAGSVLMVDSVKKKATFLRTVIRELGLSAKVSSDRVEALNIDPVEVITARAFAPLPKLLEYALPFWKSDSRAILLKGQQAEAEIEEAKLHFVFDVESTQSITDPEGRIVVITNLSKRDL